MSVWNYRICKDVTEEGDEESFSVREVYYDDAGGIFAYTDPIDLTGSSPNEVLEDLKKMAEGFSKPVLDLSTVVFSEGPHGN